jgi:hypothetical protein
MPTLEQQEIATLKSRVSRLEARLEYLYKHFGVTFVEDTHLTDDPKVIAAIKANNMLEAIKLYRAATSTGSVTVTVDDAKAAIEEMRSRLGI